MTLKVNQDSKLFSGFQIKDKTYRNRIVCAPHWTSFNQSANYTDRYIEYLAARAQGGAGWVVTEPMGTTQNSRNEIVEGLRGWDRRVIPNWQKLTDRIHNLDARISMTIGHAGRNAGWADTGQAAWAPSPDPSVITREIPSQMSKSDIRFLASRISEIAANAAEAGFDSIELQVTADYLFGSFLSPLTNYRTDEYGGSLENRMRALQEALTLTKETVGEKLLLGFRISADHMVSGGLTKEESAEVVARLHQAQVLDFVSVIVGSYYSLAAITPAMGGPVGLAVDSANTVRDVAGVPVVVAGRIPTADHAEEVLQSDQADFIAFARPFIADPEWPNKILSKKSETIYPCLYCNQQCVTRLSQKLPLSCVQNPTAGKEVLLKIVPNTKLNSKHICVVGGGPAGIEAAISLKKSGFYVTLIEQANELGGRLLKAASLPGREEWLNVIRPRIKVMEDLDIEVKLGTKVTATTINELNPDGVVVAVGSSPWTQLQYRGELNSGDFATTRGNFWHSLDDALSAQPENQKILLVDETGRRSIVSLVDWLLKRNCEITAVTTFPYLGYPAMVLSQEWSIARETFKHPKIKVLPFSKVVKAESSESVQIVEMLSGEESKLGPFDMAIMAFGDVANDFGLLPETQVWKVGDCASPRDIGAALSDGYRVARMVQDFFAETVRVNG